ncbi:MAG: DNA mismatch repair endonuclease MutL [Bryobacteraceae bacterium]|nr:DNA mismatch repair endonuclease MutL [Bryobacteraceae bacterium]MCX7605059.1 DNA mismatch repair endonuclease MutL [Bryobacteraceae bacterium]
MGRIHVLPDQVANKIAAGEVVERPASVVKELLENSLDAGAGDIRVEAEGGGRRLIRVTDDGCGMLRDDALLALERHATSKISRVEELECIATLGFRGEALPSIASVSRMVIETRAAEEPVGARVEVAGGRLLSVSECVRPPGTSITVRDLFFNVPARRKFLRTEQTELAHIASLVTHYSLAHPAKSFELVHEGRTLLSAAPVATAAERVFQVFGAETLEELVELEPRTAAEGRFTLSGFISRPQVQKTNRNSIFLFVNRRLIRDRLLLHAISAAYANLMPPSAFPFALLFLDCDPGEVDVNVHPSKTEVRFRAASFVHDFVRDALRETLVASRPAPAAPLPSLPVPGVSQPAARLPYSEFTQALEDFRLAGIPPDTPRSVLPELTLAPPPEPQPRLDLQPADPPTPPGPAPAAAAPPTPACPAAEPAAAPPGPEASRLRLPDTHASIPEGLALDPPSSMAALEQVRILGQLHDSFIIAAGPDGLWIIDQHVAHERILFEKFLDRLSRGRAEQQRLLLPLILTLTPAQEADYQRIAGELSRAGFETEPFGHRTIAVKAAPADLPPQNIEQAVFEILEIADAELRRFTVEEFRAALAASLACRAAIKINTRLEPEKMEWLVRELARTRYPMSCPHGRPVALRYSNRDILRSFHRI